MAVMRTFVPLPADGRIGVAWPTPNHNLFGMPNKFFARTAANPDYGRPGWTRDGGKQFHAGCDIAPVRVSPTGLTTRVKFTDPATGLEYDSEQPTFVPLDDVYCVHDGRVVEAVMEAERSNYGLSVLVEHRWPHSQRRFYTLYAHLAAIEVRLDSDCAAGDLIGRMGQTSRSADARNWMAVAPHLHFEVRNEVQKPYDPVEFLTSHLPRD